MFLDVDVALSGVPVNLLPLLDDTTFKDIESAVAYNAAGMALKWNFVASNGTFTQTAVTPTTAGVYDWTHKGGGMYSIEIPASGGASINNDTEGYGWFSGVATGVLPWRGPVIGFRAAALNDALIDGGDLLDVSVTQWLGTAAATPTVAGVPEVDITHIGGTAATAAAGIPEVKVASIATGAITAGSIAADAITDAKVASDVTIASVTGAVGSVTGAVGSVTGAVGSVTGAVGSVTGNVGGNVVGAVASVTAGVTVTTNNDKAGYALSSAGVQAIWDAAVSALTTVGSIGKRMVDYLTGDSYARLGAPAGASVSADVAAIKAETASILTDTAEIGAAGAGLTAVASATNLATVAGYLDTEVAAIKAKTDNLPAAPAATGDIPTAATVADAVWDEVLSGHLTSGTTGAGLNAAGSAGDPWSTAVPGAYGAGTAGKILGDNLDAAVSTRLATSGYTAPLDASGTATATQTGLTAQGYTNTRAGYLDTLNGLVAAIWAAATSGLTTLGSIGKLCVDYLDVAVSSRLASAGYTAPPSAATVASQVRTELTTELGRVDVAVSTRGTGTALDAAGVRTALGLAAANLDTQLDALPTNAELSTALGTADDAVLAAIAALNNLSSAGAQAAASAALTAYAAAKTSDVPTAVQNADALLGRNIAGGANGGRMVKDSLRFNRNKFTIAGGTLTVYEEDDTTVAWTATITTTAGDPVSASDPA